MILEMAADALGDRVAFGTRDDGLTYDELRRAAPRRSPSGSTGTVAPTTARGDRAQLSPMVPATLFGAAWAGVSYAPLNYRLPDAQLDELIGRIATRGRSRRRTGSTPAYDDAREFPECARRPAVLLFTSGTSAEPKAAILEHDQLLAYVFNTLEFGSRG